ncbi:MAG: DsrE family protein [Actinobacteria bacterium]|nr:DsrE family protein [Actinomycetota bacterium]
MKFGIIINSNDPETVWNAFRFGLKPLTKGDEVRVFLTGRGVEAEQLDTEQFAVTQMMTDFMDLGGSVLCCGSCAEKIRGMTPKICAIGGMNDMYEIVADCDRVLTF